MAAAGPRLHRALRWACAPPPSQNADWMLGRKGWVYPGKRAEAEVEAEEEADQVERVHSVQVEELEMRTDQALLY